MSGRGHRAGRRQSFAARNHELRERDREYANGWRCPRCGHWNVHTSACLRLTAAGDPPA